MPTFTTPRLLLALAKICLSVFLITPYAQAQDYPNKPIKVVIPFAPGGPSDIVGRILLQQMSENLNKPIIIENKLVDINQIGAIDRIRPAQIAVVAQQHKR